MKDFYAALKTSVSPPVSRLKPKRLSVPEQQELIQEAQVKQQQQMMMLALMTMMMGQQGQQAPQPPQMDSTQGMGPQGGMM